MRTRLALVAALVVLLDGCANPDLSSETDELTDQVADLPGVATARSDYAAPVTLDSGKVEMTVEMDDGASSAQLQEVGRVVYDAFRTTHRDEEGDVDVAFGDSTLHLRSFQPKADTEDVVREWALAHDVAQEGAATVEVMTQDAPGPEHVKTDVLLTLGEGTGADDVLASLDTLEQRWGSDEARRGWGVAAGDGSSLSVDRGFPGEETLDAWAALRDAADPASQLADVGAGLREFENRTKGPYRFLQVVVAGRDTPLDTQDPAVRDALLDSARAQIDLLADGSRSWSYDLEVDGQPAVSLDPTLCDPSVPALGPLDEALRDDRTCPGA